MSGGNSLSGQQTSGLPVSSPQTSSNVQANMQNVAPSSPSIQQPQQNVFQQQLANIPHYNSVPMRNALPFNTRGVIK